MARPPRQRGLGPQGLERIRRELEEASQFGIFTRQPEPETEPATAPASYDYQYTSINATEEDVKNLMQDNNVIVDSSLIGRGDQFSKLFSPIYLFTQVKPNYGSGPLKSTRVSVHQYIPDSWDDVYSAIRDALSIKQSGDIGTYWASSVTGSVYVEWQVPWKEFAGTRYDGIDLLDYINFSLSTSKGRYVKSWEQFDYENVGALPF